MKDPEVQFNWYVVAIDVTIEEDASEPFNLILECWVAMRDLALYTLLLLL